MKVDAAKPTVTLTTPANNAEYDLNEAVSASYSCADSGSGIKATGGCVGTVANGSAIDTSSTGSKSFTVTATDNVGNVETVTHNYTVVNPDSVAPTSTHSLSADANSNGWHNSDVTVTLNATDNDGGSGVDEIRYSINGGANAVYDAANKPVISTEGTTTFSYFAVDNNNNSESPHSFDIKLDKTAPEVAYKSASPNANANGWRNQDVTATFEANDQLSGMGATDAAKTTTNTATTTGEGTDISVGSPAFTDRAGNTAPADTATSPDFKIDKTAPLVAYQTGSATPAANAAGWNNTNVTVTFEANDQLSGMGATDAAKTATNTATTTGEGTNISVGSPAFTDRAGNSAAAGTATSSDFKIDKTKPVVTVTGVSNGATYTTGNVPTPDCDTQDQPNLSGVKTDASVNVTGGTGGFGTLTATCSGAVDNADNNQAAPVSVTYSVKAAFDGFLQPIDGHAVNTGKYGRTYPIKWQLRDSSGALISDSAAQLLVGTMTGGQKLVTCNNFSLEPEDALEESTTGNTSLRYDATSDQFIYNYKAPASGGPCFVFAIRNADGVTTQQVDFKFTK